MRAAGCRAGRGTGVGSGGGGREEMGQEAHLLDLLWDVGNGEAIQPCHPGKDIGQDAPVQLEGDLPNYAPVLLCAGDALDL